MNIFTEWNNYIEQKIPVDELSHMESLTRHVNIFFYEIQKKHEEEINKLTGSIGTMELLLARDRDLVIDLKVKLGLMSNKEQFFSDEKIDQNKYVTKEYVDSVTKITDDNRINIGGNIVTELDITGELK